MAVDEETVRGRAADHGNAVVAGDIRKAGTDLTPAAMAKAGAVMAKLPKPATSAEVVSVETSGDNVVARILYRGSDSETTVASTWGEQEGRPMIVDLEVV